MPGRRKDRVGEFRTAYEKNKKIIFQTQNICGICGQPVDMDLKYPDPMSKTVDHIIPIAKGGHPSDLANLQLAHRWCNRQKGAKMFLPGFQNNPGVQNNPPGSNGPEISTGRDEETTGAINKPGHTKADSGRTAADNDNLPQHADWAAMKW